MTTTSLPAASRRQATPQPDLETRLAARDADMAVRLETAGLRHGVTSLRPETTVDLADVVRLTPTDQTATPVAALLTQARHRIMQPGGWSRDTVSNGRGGMCPIAAIQAEARSHREEGEARRLLRQALGGSDSIPEMNRRLRGPQHAALVLGQAAQLAAREGL